MVRINSDITKYVCTYCFFFFMQRAFTNVDNNIHESPYINI